MRQPSLRQDSKKGVAACETSRDIISLVAVLGLLAFGCSREPILPQAPAPTVSGPFDLGPDVFTETLGDIGIPRRGGDRNRRRRGGNQDHSARDASSVNVPGTVKQAILFWEGNNPTPVGDNQITVGGKPGDGDARRRTDLLLHKRLYDDVPRGHHESRRRDLRREQHRVSGMDYAKNNGAGVMVIYDDGSAPAQMGVKEGNDCAYYLFAPPLNTTVPQTFTFTAATVARQATLAVLASSVEDNRPNVIRVTVGRRRHRPRGPAPQLGRIEIRRVHDDGDHPGRRDRADGAVSVGEGSVEHFHRRQRLARLELCGVFRSRPELASLGDYVWYDANHDGIQNAEEDGIQGVPVKLYACGGTTPLATTTTDATGYYLFSNLTPGEYFVEFTPLVNHVFSPKDQGPTTRWTATPISTTGKTVCTTLSSRRERHDLGCRDVHSVRRAGRPRLAR